VGVFNVVDRSMKVFQVGQKFFKLLEIVLVFNMVDRIVQFFLVWFLLVSFSVVVPVIDIIDRVRQLLQVSKLVINFMEFVIPRLNVIARASKGSQVGQVLLNLAKVVLTEDLVDRSVQGSLVFNFVHLAVILVRPVHCVDWTCEVLQLDNVLLDLCIFVLSVDVIDRTRKVFQLVDVFLNLGIGVGPCPLYAQSGSCAQRHKLDMRGSSCPPQFALLLQTCVASQCHSRVLLDSSVPSLWFRSHCSCA